MVGSVVVVVDVVVVDDGLVEVVVAGSVVVVVEGSSVVVVVVTTVDGVVSSEGTVVDVGLLSVRQRWPGLSPRHRCHQTPVGVLRRFIAPSSGFGKGATRCASVRTRHHR